MDYNKFGFKNKVVDKFNNMYGSGMGDGPGDKEKEAAKNKATNALKSELDSLKKTGKGKAANERITEIEGKLGITAAKKAEMQSVTPNEARQRNLDALQKEKDQLLASGKGKAADDRLKAINRKMYYLQMKM